MAKIDTELKGIVQRNLGYISGEYGEMEGMSNVDGSSNLEGFGTMCVAGRVVYASPATYAFLNSTRKGRLKIESNKTICNLRKVARKDSKNGGSGSSSTDSGSSNIPADSGKAPVTVAPTTTKSKTGMYIGIGIGAILLITGVIVLIKRRKK